MSKGIIVAENMKEAIRSHDSIYLENDFLEEVFLLIKNEKSKFPSLIKLVGDFYADAEFSADRLLNLVSEIEILLEEKKITKKTAGNLRKTLEIAKVSNEENKTLFAFAD